MQKYLHLPVAAERPITMVEAQVHPPERGVCYSVGWPGRRIVRVKNMADRFPISNSPAAARTVPADDEAQLVAAARSGDLAAFEQLVTRYECKIFRLTMNITQNREDAEDAMQEAFLKSYEHLPGFHGDSRFYTWLVRIAANQALMKLRKRRPNQVSLDEPAATEDDEVPHEIEDWGPSPEQRYARTELHDILAQAISTLEPDYRTVFTLRDIENISTEETARILGLSVPAVKTRLLRARLKLRNKLSAYFERSEKN
jgi:RNA polymerase sigma-70 factor (ECF subfamily)